MSNFEILTTVFSVVSLVFTIVSGYNMMMLNQLSRKINELEDRIVASLMEISKINEWIRIHNNKIEK